MSTSAPRPRRGRNAWRGLFVLLVLLVGAAIAWSYLVPRAPAPDAAPLTPTPTPSPC